MIEWSLKMYINSDGEAGRSVIEWMYILKGASKNEIKNVDKGKSLS